MTPIPEDRTGPDPATSSSCGPVWRPPRTAPPPARHPRPLLTAAEAAASSGLHVFPLWPGSKTPSVDSWQEVATCSHAQIGLWWTQHPWNIGIATGPSGLLVVDLDVGRGDPAPPEWAGAQCGRDVLARQAAAHGQPMPEDTFTVLTPSGGSHLYFRQPPGLELRNTQGRLGWRIDTRGHGGYVVGADSRRGGTTYRVVRDVAIAELPGWLAAALAPAPSAVSSLRPRATVRLNVASDRAAAYLRAVVAGEAAAVAGAPVGQRHHILLRAARRLGHWVGGGVLEGTEARDTLAAAAGHYIGVHGYTERQVARDITDGLAYGAQLPRTVDLIPPRAAG